MGTTYPLVTKPAKKKNIFRNYTELSSDASFPVKILYKGVKFLYMASV